MSYRDTYECSTYFRRKVRHYCQAAALTLGLDPERTELVELAVMYAKLGTTRYVNPHEHDWRCDYDDPRTGAECYRGECDLCGY